MTKRPRTAAPTAPRRMNDAGYELDRHGLPLVGPARMRALNGKADPALAPAEAAEAAVNPDQAEEG